jgi:hypothetical protein
VRVVESDDRFFPRMIDHVSKAASEPCQDREACLIRLHLIIQYNPSKLDLYPATIIYVYISILMVLVFA